MNFLEWLNSLLESLSKRRETPQPDTPTTPPSAPADHLRSWESYRPGEASQQAPVKAEYVLPVRTADNKFANLMLTGAPRGDFQQPVNIHTGGVITTYYAQPPGKGRMSLTIQQGVPAQTIPVGLSPLDPSLSGVPSPSTEGAILANSPQLTANAVQAGAGMRLLTGQGATPVPVGEYASTLRNAWNQASAKQVRAAGARHDRVADLARKQGIPNYDGLLAFAEGRKNDVDVSKKPSPDWVPPPHMQMTGNTHTPAPHRNQREMDERQRDYELRTQQTFMTTNPDDVRKGGSLRAMRSGFTHNGVYHENPTRHFDDPNSHARVNPKTGRTEFFVDVKGGRKTNLRVEEDKNNPGLYTVEVQQPGAEKKNTLITLTAEQLSNMDFVVQDGAGMAGELRVQNKVLSPEVQLHVVNQTSTTQVTFFGEGTRNVVLDSVNPMDERRLSAYNHLLNSGSDARTAAVAIDKLDEKIAKAKAQNTDNDVAAAIMTGSGSLPYVRKPAVPHL